MFTPPHFFSFVTAHKRSCGKVMFLHLSVSHSVHGVGACVPHTHPCHACPLACTPPSTYAPLACTAPATHAPSLPCMPPCHACSLPCTLPCHACPLPCMPPRHAVNERAVRILLECILVSKCRC